MRYKIAFYIPAFFVVAVSFVSLSQATQSKDNDRYKDNDGYKSNQLVDRVLANGGFNCDVTVIEPNGETGEPRLSAFVRFDQQLNLTGVASAGTSFEFGSKDELDKFCQELAENLSSTAEDLRCTAGPIKTLHTVGGNFVSDSWFLSIICNGDRNQVVNAVGILVEEMILANEPGQATIQKKSMKQVDSMEQVDSILRERFQLLRGLANGPAPVIGPDSSSESR